MPLLLSPTEEKRLVALYRHAARMAWERHEAHGGTKAEWVTQDSAKRVRAVIDELDEASYEMGL
jgi:hypothetical protein